MQISLEFVDSPAVIAIFSAWLGMSAHILKKQIGSVDTYQHLKRYLKRHFTTIVFSAIIATGIGINAMSGYDPRYQTVWDLMSFAFGGGYIGDSVMEIQRKREELR